MALTNKDKARLAKNAEVTTSGIKARGTNIKSTQQIVTVKSTPLGNFKKRMISACLAVSATGNAIGLGLDWTPDMVHVAYPLAGVDILGFVLIFLTKME